MAFTRGVTATNVDATGNPVLTLATSGTFNLAAGKTMPVLVAWENDSGTCSLADVAGNTFTPCTKVNDGVNAMNIQIFYVLSTLASAVNVVTATFPSTTANFCSIWVGVYNPAGTASFVGQNSGTGTSANPASGSATAGTMAVGGVKDFSGSITLTPGTGWSLTQEYVSNASHFIDRIDAPGGSIPANGTLSGSAAWLAALATFTDSGGGGSVNTLLGSKPQFFVNDIYSQF